MTLVDALLAYPTVVYSGVLVLVLAYWLLVIAGAVDLDQGGGHDALLDVAAAKGEAAAHALHAHGTSADGVDAPGIDDASAVAGALSLRRAPLTVTVSFLALFGWVTSFVAMRFLGPIAAQVMPEALFGTIVLVASLLFAVPLASLATKPLEHLFKTTEGRKRHELVGTVCEIRSGRVDDGFGQATLQDQGAELVINVRIDVAGERAEGGSLKRGDSAVIIDYDEERGAYVVEPYEDFLKERGASLSER